MHTYKLICLDVLPLNFRPLSTEAELRSLELGEKIHQKSRLANKGWFSYHEICILSARHFMIEHTGIRRTNGRLEARIHLAHLSPVQVKGLNIFILDARP
jgi:hypothetical protein